MINDEHQDPQRCRLQRPLVAAALLFLLAAAFETGFKLSPGGSATPISFGELYTALQQGVVDAQENPISTIYGNRFYEVLASRACRTATGAVQARMTKGTPRAAASSRKALRCQALRLAASTSTG